VRQFITLPSLTSSELPTVSVVISSFNHGPYVLAAIRSVLSQTYPKVELIVGDDGSTDESVAIISELAKRENFKFFSSPNQGLCKNLNFLIGKSSGEFLVPFGSDDIMLPERIETQVAHMITDERIGVCGAQVEVIDLNGCVVSGARSPVEAGFYRASFEDLLSGSRGGVGAPTLMMRRSAFLAAGGFSEHIKLEDVQIVLKIAKQDFFVDVLPQILTRYRKHSLNTYKNYPYMYEQLCQTLRLFADNPLYSNALTRHRRSYFVKAVNSGDRILARKIFNDMKYKDLNIKILGKLIIFLFSGFIQFRKH
jgi:alpha-1,3-rhamnosyltransferase